MSIWPASLSVKDASKLMSWVSATFSCCLVNATVWTLLLKSFAGKKRFSRGVSANTARFLRFFSLDILAFLSVDGITDFGIALAKHCNLIFCSSVLQIDWSKPVLTDHAITLCWKWLDELHILMMQRKNSNHWRKKCVSTTGFMTKQRWQFGCGYHQTPQEITESLILNSNHSRTSFAD